jgi:hypothetical protein
MSYEPNVLFLRSFKEEVESPSLNFYIQILSYSLSKNNNGNGCGGETHISGVKHP